MTEIKWEEEQSLLRSCRVAHLQPRGDIWEIQARVDRDTPSLGNTKYRPVVSEKALLQREASELLEPTV